MKNYKIASVKANGESQFDVCRVYSTAVEIAERRRAEGFTIIVTYKGNKVEI